ncbi:MAG: hypothetical protein IKH90_01920 [Ruminococcus sp.]|nr:hypothetical protein [Ruminococcus sp.]MBR7007385.1 hypothetical protein [Ruminococcus sp.]
MGDKLPWILMGGGTAIILVTSWCRVLLDINRTVFFAMLAIGLIMVIVGRILYSRGSDKTDDNSGNGPDK